MRTDKQLGDFFEWLYGKFGSDEVVVLLSADHGATPVPEQMAAIGFDAGRIKKKAIKEAIDGALTKRFGAAGGEGWVVAMEDPHVFLNRKAMADKKLDAKEVERVAGEGAMTLKGFAGFLTRTQLMTGAVPPTDLARSCARTTRRAEATWSCGRSRSTLGQIRREGPGLDPRNVVPLRLRGAGHTATV